MPTTSEERIAQAAQEILNTRDCCGDEREALRDYEASNGRFTADERDRVYDAVENAWRQSQRDAGVTKPISAGERLSITNALDQPDGCDEAA